MGASGHYKTTLPCQPRVKNNTVYNGSIPWLIFEGDAYYSAVPLEEAEKGGAARACVYVCVCMHVYRSVCACRGMCVHVRMCVWEGKADKRGTCRLLLLCIV